MYHTCQAHALGPASHSDWPLCHSSWGPRALEPVLHSKRGHHNEKPPHHNQEETLFATARETPRKAMKTQRNQKINK